MAVNKEDLFVILERNIGWIENCDLKASILLGIFGVIVTICASTEFAQIFKKVILHCFNNINFLTVFYLIILILLTGLSFIGILYLVLSLKATISPKDFNNRGLCDNSILFCSSIVNNNKNVEDYVSRIKNTNEDELTRDIISQIYICSLICDKKFKRYNLGLKKSLIGLICFILLIIIGFLLI